MRCCAPKKCNFTVRAIRLHSVLEGSASLVSTSNLVMCRLVVANRSELGMQAKNNSLIDAHFREAWKKDLRAALKVQVGQR